MKKNLLPLYFIVASVIIGLSVFAYYSSQDQTKTKPVIKLSYFKSVPDLAEALLTQIQPQLQNETQFWIGIEPNKTHHIVLAEELVFRLKTAGKIEKVFVDEQLGLSELELAGIAMAFPDFKIWEVKENWSELSELQKNKQLNNSVVITAAIYSTSVLKQNPLDKIKNENPDYEPMTFSSAHFALDTADEKNLTFPCRNEDSTGTSNWACGILNKARSQRKKIQPLAEVEGKAFLGVVDSTDEKDFMIVFTERK